MNNNSIGKIGFITEHIFWAALSWIWYKNILFRCIPDHSLTESRTILLSVIFISCIVGIIFQMGNDRNGISVIFNLVFAYGIYTVIAYMNIRFRLIAICLVISAGLSIGYTVLILSRRINNQKRRYRIILKRAIQASVVSKKLISSGLAIIMVITGVNALFGSSILKSDVRPSTLNNLSDQTISNNIDKVLLLQDDIWAELTVLERLNVLQTIANIEQRYLGLPNELNVCAANLDEGTLGYYSDNTHEIVISMDSLLYDSPWDVLDTVCHEAYHSYQHRLVEALYGADDNSRNLKLFRKAYSYANEFENYINGEIDFCSYYFQDCEYDAREYAESAVKDYYRRIKTYLEEGE